MAIAAGGAKEWDFAWSEFQKATIASEAEKLRSALSLHNSTLGCSKVPGVHSGSRHDPKGRDATSTIVYIANNVVGQSLAWDFLQQFKADNSDVGFGSGTLAVDQSIERTIGNMKWIAENKQNVLNCVRIPVQAHDMGKGFYISKAVGVVGVILGVGALATIIALSVVYSQEKAKNNDNQYRLPKSLVPEHYNVKLWPRLTADPTTGLYIFTDGEMVEPGLRRPGSIGAVSPGRGWSALARELLLAGEPGRLSPEPRIVSDIEEPQQIAGVVFFQSFWDGESTVQFKCTEDTDLILIHSNKLNYTKLENGQWARLSAVNSGVKAPAINTSWLQPVTQYLVLQLDGKLMKDQWYHLFTDFTGELADDLGGFYRSVYMENGQRKVVATTQMQPTDARKAFPCFDEPAMKATFNITLIHDPVTVALSNGAQRDSKAVNIDGKTLKQTDFEQTEKMSTYLLAFIVSEFGFINNTVDNVLVTDTVSPRKLAKPGGRAAREADRRPTVFL
ncbi:unnamed protein product [Pleuronectes platessa]|uniref:Aminopeptidase N-like N-terminal domain-containing protein n=1 Tax=Pleuronectes platessa TaxID=8262 RepID=A0A9N7UK52_PLEPL|nr:unnamed protein product [Pleuronectes platessa]